MMSASFKRQRGISLIEIMVGVVIALIAVLVIYQVFALSEGVKRNTTAIGDAQQNGLFSSFTLGIELANAGNGIETAAQELATCTGPDTLDVTRTLRPIPVLITDSGNPNTPDQFIVNYSMSSSLVTAALFTNTDPDNTKYHVNSPTGFKPGDRIAAISTTGDCAMSKVTGVTSPPDPTTGEVVISHSGTTINFPVQSVLFNMGPFNGAQRMRYDVVSDVLRSQNLFEIASVPNPLTANVVNVKVQYGIDTGNDGLLDCWVAGSGAWAPAAVLAAPLAGAPVALSRIKAVRIGLVVRSDQWDRDAPDYNYTLFDDGVVDACHPAVGGSAPRAGGNWRYRTYQTIIPLRNKLWNPAS